jgi:hypothetical protein
MNRCILDVWVFNRVRLKEGGKTAYAWVMADYSDGHSRGRIKLAAFGSVAKDLVRACEKLPTAIRVVGKVAPDNKINIGGVLVDTHRIIVESISEKGFSSTGPVFYDEKGPAVGETVELEG